MQPFSSAVVVVGMRICLDFGLSLPVGEQNDVKDDHKVKWLQLPMMTL